MKILIEKTYFWSPKLKRQSKMPNRFIKFTAENDAEKEFNKNLKNHFMGCSFASDYSYFRTYFPLFIEAFPLFPCDYMDDFRKQILICSLKKRNLESFVVDLSKY